MPLKPDTIQSTLSDLRWNSTHEAIIREEFPSGGYQAAYRHMKKLGLHVPFRTNTARKIYALASVLQINQSKE
jgi:hypothetical protein